MATAPILAGDIKLLASKIMDDVPNGGGGPTGNVIPDGESNAIFGDVTERARAGGSVSIRQLHLAVQTDNTSAFMDPSIIVSTPPNDANVSITLAKCDTFALRTAIANTIENYLIAGPVWPGFLFEGHVAGQRSIQLFQRPGTPTPTIGRTLALVYDEGKPGERTQFVRVTRAETVSRTFTAVDGKLYQGDIVTCELTDALRFDFPGSPPSESFARVVAGTLTRDTTVADAAQFFGVTPLSALAHVGDSLLRVASVYTQLVPSARTESAALDQKPAAQRTLTLAQTPRLIEVGVTPHTMRIRVGQENRGFSWVQMLKPRPAPGTIVISYMALGNWYTIYDDGAGGFEGTGVGQVIYNTGSVSMTFPSMPDAGTSIIIQWGENTAYTSRAGQAGFRAPEVAWALPQAPVKPGSVVVSWMSGGTLSTATDNGSGGFTGGATGEVNYATGQIFLRPSAMLDAGGEFVADYVHSTQITESFPSLTPDAGGFALISLLHQPVPNSLCARWVTVRNVSESSGSTEVVSTSDSNTATTTLSGTGAVGWVLYVNDIRPGYTQLDIAEPLRFTLRFHVSGQLAPVTGTYRWQLASFYDNTDGNVTGQAGLATLLDGGATGGDFEVPGLLGYFELQVAAARIPTLKQMQVLVKHVATDSVVASAMLSGLDSYVYRPTPPAPADTVRDSSGVCAAPGMRSGGAEADTGAPVRIACQPLYDAEYGWCYDPPAYGGSNQLWTAAELAAQKKTMVSDRGVNTEYVIW